jgi:hypothetical protein
MFGSLEAWLPDDIYKYVFTTKNPNLGTFWRASEWKMLIYFVVVWYILWPFGIFGGRLVYFAVLVYFVVFWYILCEDKSGSRA